MTIPIAWRQALVCLLLSLAAVLLLYSDTALAMVEIWNRSETYAHAFVVPPIVIWLVWRQRSVLAQQVPKPALGWLLPLVGFAFLWLLGDLVSANSVAQLALVGMLVCVVPLILGWSVARLIAFPLGFSFFAVPIGEFMTPQLMEWTADFTVAAIRLSGIPVYREGQDFVIPSGSWSVVEACSGIRYLMASVMVGTLFAYLNFNSLRKRLIFVLVAFLMPVIANWLRAYFIVMLGHFSGNKLAVGADHLIYGWVFFGIIMLAMFMIGAKWSDPEIVPASVHNSLSHRAPAATPQWVLAGVAVFMVLLAPLGALKQLAVQATDAELVLQAPDLSKKGWQQEPKGIDEWVPAYEGSKASLQSAYRKSSADADLSVVGLHIAYYRAQSYQDKLISSTNELTRTTDSTWATVSRNVSKLELPETSLPLRSAELRGGGVAGHLVGHAGHVGQQRLSVRYVYWVNGRLTTSDAMAKLYGALGLLKGQGDDAAAVFVSAPHTEKGSADALLEEFLRDNWLDLEQKLRATRDSVHNPAPAR
ncbi:exosortase A [Roseateles sp.]|uniref:exosortase A n=1 Tax=Roseateles sp. TaxID=1971397 RepID=UPI003BA5CBD5